MQELGYIGILNKNFRNLFIFGFVFMKKKYWLKDLISLNTKYLSTENVNNSFSVSHFYPAFWEISSSWLHKTYLKDFFFKFHEQRENVQTSFLFSPFYCNSLALESIQEFFSKKKQVLGKIWNAKLFNYLDSKIKKKKNQNLNTVSLFYHEPCSFFDPTDFTSFLRKEFFSLRNKGIIKCKKEIWYVSFDLQENVPLDRVVFKKEILDKYFIKYFIDGKGIALTVTAFDVDLIFWDVALLVHPWDKRYKQYIGKNVLIPLINKSIPILWDDTVDISKDGWIVRVNPFSDPNGINFAEKHHLPLDVAVFDLKGNYTDVVEKFAWKSRRDFSSNIFEFLRDLTNLWESEPEEALVPYSAITGEKLSPFLLDVFYLDCEKEKLQLSQWVTEYSDSLEQSRDTIQELIQNDLPLNAYAEYWEKIPLYWNNGYQLTKFPFEKNDYQDSLGYYFDAFLFFVATSFFSFSSLSFHNFISFFVSFEKKIPLFFESFFENSIKNEEQSDFLTFFSSLKQWEENSFENLQTLLEHSKMLTFSSEMVTFTFGHNDNTQFLSLIFSDVFLQVMQVFYLQKQGINFYDWWFFSQEDCAFFVLFGLLHLIVFQHLPYKKLELSSLNFLTQQKDFFFLEDLRLKYGDDTIRLNLLVDRTLEEEACKKYSLFLASFWNGVRYWRQNFSSFSSFDDALQIASQSEDKMDIWFLSELCDLYQNYQAWETYEKALAFFPEVMHFAQEKLLSWYLEFKKDEKSQTSSAALQIWFSFILDFLYLFVPTYLRALLQELWWKYPCFHEFSFFKSKTTEQVCLYEIWSSLSEFKKRLHLGKHEPIRLFLKSNPWMVEIFQHYEGYLKKMFVIQDALTLSLHEEEPEWYDSENFWTFFLGIQKWESKFIGKKQRIAELEHKKKNKEQHLDYIKGLYLSGMVMFWPQIQELKQEIEEVTLEIQKLKKNLE